jgi:putative sigma-54 modulation protein
MDIKITGKTFAVTDALRAYIEQKMSALSRFDQGIALIDVEVDKNMHHKKGEVFHVRANIDIPGKGLIRAEDMSPDMYAAVDLCQKQLEMQLSHERDREKHNRQRAHSQRENKSIMGWLKFWKKSE